MAPLAGHYAAAGMDWEKIEGSLRAEAQSYLDDVTAELKPDGTEVSTAIAEGLTASAIIAEAGSEEGTLVAMSTHARRGVTRGLIGSVTDDVLRNGDFPMLVMRAADGDKESAAPKLDTLVLTLDGSDLAEEVLPEAVVVAKAMELKVDLLTVLPADDPAFAQGLESSAVRDRMLVYLQGVEDRLVGQGVSNVGQVVLHGRPAEAIIDLVDNLPGAMIAMTTHGWSGAERWLLGSVADRVIRHSQRPVLLVRAKA